MNEFVKGLGIFPKSRAQRWALAALVIAFVAFALADLPKALSRSPAQSSGAAESILHASAIDQCKELILRANKRAKFGFDTVMTTATGDVLVEMPFTVPVFGFAERDELTARCAMRKDGRFEISVS